MGPRLDLRALSQGRFESRAACSKVLRARCWLAARWGRQGVQGSGCSRAAYKDVSLFQGVRFSLVRGQVCALAFRLRFLCTQSSTRIISVLSYGRGIL